MKHGGHFRPIMSSLTPAIFILFYCIFNYYLFCFVWFLFCILFYLCIYLFLAVITDTHATRQFPSLFTSQLRCYVLVGRSDLESRC